MSISVNTINSWTAFKRELSGKKEFALGGLTVDVAFPPFAWARNILDELNCVSRHMQYKCTCI